MTKNSQPEKALYKMTGHNWNEVVWSLKNIKKKKTCKNLQMQNALVGDE